MSAGTHTITKYHVMLKMPDGKVYFSDIALVGAKFHKMTRYTPYVLVLEMNEKTYEKDEESEDEG